MKAILRTGILLVMFMSACTGSEDQSDAQGTFEGNPLLVSSRLPGILLEMNVKEGQQIEENAVVGVVDTMQLHLELEHIRASLATVDSRLATVDAQINALRVQQKNVEREYRRIINLLEAGAATEQKKDELSGNIEQIKAQIQALQSQKVQITASVNADRIRTLQIEDQIQNAFIRNPVKGVVLQKYKDKGEIVNAGMTLYKVADLDTLTLRAYISGNQLSEIKIGQEVSVFIDEKESLQKLPGTITWVASEAEFTPKIIQTRDERVNLVYAIKVSVPNDGRIKIGMPGEVKF